MVLITSKRVCVVIICVGESYFSNLIKLHSFLLHLQFDSMPSFLLVLQHSAYIRHVKKLTVGY